MNERPAIRLFHDPAAPPDLVTAFQLGCEEEGVPLITVPRIADAEALARSAAFASVLFVGAGIDAIGTVALHEQRLGKRRALILIRSASPSNARRLGSAAGRLVRGRPLPDDLD